MQVKWLKWHQHPYCLLIQLTNIPWLIGLCPFKLKFRATRLYQIPGSVPSPYDFATGDRFASRSLRPDANPEQKLVLTAVEGEPSHLWASHLAKPVTEAKGA